MSQKKKKSALDLKKREEIRGIQIQWFFIVIASMVAFFLGVTVNAVYALLEKFVSVLNIFLFFGIVTVLLIDILTQLFDRIEYIRDHPQETYVHFLLGYIRKRLNSVWQFIASKLCMLVVVVIFLLGLYAVSTYAVKVLA